MNSKKYWNKKKEYWDKTLEETNKGNNKKRIDFDLKEQEAQEHLMQFMEIVLKDWELNCNKDEFILGIHHLQMFIIKHMLQREEVVDWSMWYGKDN